MIWWPFKKKDAADNLKQEVDESLNNVKKDIKKAADWITHLHSKGKNHDDILNNIDNRLEILENDVLEIKNFVSFFGSKMSKQLSKQPQTLFDKQIAVEGVATPVQTLVQTAFLGNLTMSERTVVWVILNTDMKLSCEDIAAVLNKDKSTIRGQINNIKQKSEGLISETLEGTGKKRFFIDAEKKERILSKMVKVKDIRGSKKKGK